TGVGADRRRREQALLRTRGASMSTLIRLAVLEAAVTGILAAIAGIAGALLIGRMGFGSLSFGGDARGSATWAAAAALYGLLVAGIIVAVPAWQDARRTTVARSRLSQRRAGLPAWTSLGIALLLLGGALASYIVTSRQGYQLVLAPEGVPSISVDYLAFAGPACLWVATALLTWRTADAALRH